MLETKLELEQSEDELDEDINSNSYNIYDIASWGADLSFRELITMYEENELVKPEIQRNYVWSKKEASRFIESILLGLPIPSIFLAKKGSDKLIVDGYQRIMSVYDYIGKKKFAKENSIFKLMNSFAINEKWRGKAFDELNLDDQRKIKSTTIHTIMFEQRKPENGESSFYQIFERINTGGQKLTPQEIRNCIYQGKFNQLLMNLNSNLVWRALLNNSVADSRMADIELILRFFTLSQKKILNSNISSIVLKSENNSCMDSKKNISNNEIKDLESIFINCITFIKDKFGENAFCNISSETGDFTKKINNTIFDSIMLSTKYIIENNLENTIPNDANEKRIELLKNKDYQNYTTFRTTLCDHIRGRVNFVLKEVYNCEHQYHKV